MQAARHSRIARAVWVALAVFGAACARTHGAPATTNKGTRTNEAGHSAAAAAGRGSSATAVAGSSSSVGGTSGTGGAGGAEASAGADAGGTHLAPTSGAAGADAGSAVEPPRTCANAWYRCKDACITMTLVGGGRSFGQCTGECNFELTLSGSIPLEGTPECFAVMVSLIVRTSDGRLLSFAGTLSEQAWQQAAEISRALAGLQLAPVGSCPDCSDAGRVTLRAADGTMQDHTYAYGNPPEPLRAADAFIQALIDQLHACEGPLIAKCNASVSTTDPDAPADSGPHCAFMYENRQNMSAISCDFPVGVDAPCRKAVECLCSTNVLGSQADRQACVDSWLAPRGAPTFADYCANGANAATRSLSDALMGFAATYNGNLTLGSECNMVPAYY